MGKIALKHVVAIVIVLSACGRQHGNSEDLAPTPNSATSDKWTGKNPAETEELFAGRFAGVQVFRVPEGIAVRIRGASSLVGSNEPLYVIDGMTVQPGRSGALVGINPADIAKIEVLKDIGSTSMYGGRGANGVIVITTKRGGR